MRNPIRSLSLAAVIGASLIALPVFAQSGPPPAPVSVAPAVKEQLAPRLWTPSSVVSRNDARISAEQVGRIVSLAEIGDQVEKGAVLAELDQRLLRLAVDEARAALARIDARLEFARAQEQRLAQLAQQSTISRAQADEAGAERRVLEEERRGADVALRQAEHRLTNARILAPFSGTVVERFVAVGEYVNTGVPLLRVVDTRQTEVQARAPVNLAQFVRPGSRVQLRAGGETIEQTVRAVVPVGDAASRQFELRIALDQPRWPIGSALEVGLPSEAPREAVTIPRDALLLRPGESFVVRVATDDTAERVAVRTGAVQGERIEVLDAISAGDRLVVRGAERVQHGQKLKIEADATVTASLTSTVAGGSR